MPEHGPKKVACKKCGRTSFPTRQGNCFYCGKPLEDHAAVHAEPRPLGGAARFTPQGDDRRHFLVLETGGHVEMSPGQLFVIGRDPHASLVVNSPDVSRQHCEVDWDDGGTKRPVLCEIRSRNGTFLNERLVARGQREPLRSGDTVRLGPGSVLRYFYCTGRDFEALLKEAGAAQTAEFRVFLPTDEDRVRAVEGAAARDASGRLAVQGLPALGAGAPSGAGAPNAPVAAAAADAPRVDEAQRLQGRLKDVSAAALLRSLNEQRVSGVLTFFDGQERGEVHLEEGRCVFATYGQYTGREVIEKLVALTEGGFRFRKASDERREKDPLPFPARGKLSDRSGSELVALIEQNGLSGELTITDGPEVSADALFVDGVWTEARFGEIVGKMAKHMVAGLRHGEYRFREAEAPGAAGAADDERALADEHAAVIAALVDPEPPPSGGWTGRSEVDRDAARASEARQDRFDPTTQPMSAFEPSTPAGRELVRDPGRDPLPPPRPTTSAPRPPAPSVAAPAAAPTDSRPPASRAAPPPLRTPRGAPPPLRPASGRHAAVPPLAAWPTTSPGVSPGVSSGVTDEHTPAGPLPRPATTAMRGSPPPRPERPGTRAVPRPAPHDGAGARATDHQPARDGAGLPAPEPGATSPLRSGQGGGPLKESPLRDTRPTPPVGTRPPLRVSGESGRNRRQAPPPLPPPPLSPPLSPSRTEDAPEAPGA